jgi:4-diphosphocytidyl-2-C-methyl-D-erythritol kinase
LEELIGTPIESWQQLITNDFEPHIFAAHPRIAEIKDMLLERGAIYAAMSGSGSALFGIFESRPTIEASADTFVHIEQIE